MISSVKRVNLYAFLARLHLENWIWMTRPDCGVIDYSVKFSQMYHWYHEQGDVV